MPFEQRVRALKDASDDEVFSDSEDTPTSDNESIPESNSADDENASTEDDSSDREVLSILHQKTNQSITNPPSPPQTPPPLP